MKHKILITAIVLLLIIFPTQSTLADFDSTSIKQRPKMSIWENIFVIIVVISAVMIHRIFNIPNYDNIQNVLSSWFE